MLPQLGASSDLYLAGDHVANTSMEASVGCLLWVPMANQQSQRS